MVALNALNSAATLLQQITSNGQPAVAGQGSTTLNQPTASVSPATGNAAKSVISAIFNAVATTSEKQDESMKAVLDFIDRDYTNFDKKFANFYATYGGEEGVQEGLAKTKAFGENLKQMVLADPAGILKELEQIKATRPEVSLDGQIDLLVAQIGSGNKAQA